MEIITHVTTFFLGLVIGMYFVTQIEKDINKRINKNK
jgi:hypothetical protein